MRFVDSVTIRVLAGHGGRGASTFRREKYVPRGGPDGGDGGRGGDVVIEASSALGTLLDLRYRKDVRAQDGKHGMGGLKDGRDGETIVVRVPVGTLVRDAHSLELLADLTEDGQRHVIARGGLGGQGNAHFKTATNQAPRYAQPGLPGQERNVTLELKLLADVGIIGYPSVGKSTLISVISNARPKIAAYPFTTLVPNLGIVRWRDYRSFVVADIPGLIEGASEGRGLGYQFLRHVERCRALLHIIEVTPEQGVDDSERDPVADFDRIVRELERFSPALAARPQIVALSKTDLPFVAEHIDRLRAEFTERGLEFLSFSAATRDGIPELIDALALLIDRTPAPDVAHFTVPEPVLEEPEVDPDELADGEPDDSGDEDDTET